MNENSEQNMFLDYREKQSRDAKKRWENPEYRDRMSKAFKKVWEIMKPSGKGDGGENPNPVFSVPPKNRFKLQSFFNFQGTAVKPQCVEPDCDVYIHDMAYWIGHKGPLCYRCWLKGEKK